MPPPKAKLKGVIGCRIRSRRGYLSLALHYRGQRWWETPFRTMKDTAPNRQLLQRDFCLPIASLMRARAFDGEAYLRFFPRGTRAVEFQPALAGSPAEGAPTLREYALRTWLPRQQPPEVRPGTQRDYRQHLAAYILDAPVAGGAPLGDVSLDEINPRHVRALKDRLAALGLSIKTQRNIISGTFRALLRDAVAEDLYDVANPFIGLRWPRVVSPPADPFTEAERATLVAHFREREPLYADFVELLFFTGMRPSEATGLVWKDFGSDRGTLDVQRSRYLNAYNLPKTRQSVRSLKLLPNVADRLRARMPGPYDPEAPIFTDPQGKPINQSEWARTHWTTALDATNLRKRKFYATRHTFISVGLTHGVNAKYLAEYCGTSLQMIERHYGRFLLSREDAQLALLMGSQPEPAAEQDRAEPRPDEGLVSVSARNRFESGVVPFAKHSNRRPGTCGGRALRDLTPAPLSAGSSRGRPTLDAGSEYNQDRRGS